jgi:hypothetical protein
MAALVTSDHPSIAAGRALLGYASSPAAPRYLTAVEGGDGRGLQDERTFAMEADRETETSWTTRSATTSEELKLICKKIADLDALWRMNPLQESPIEKRAA